jgi:hypothetical protein
MNQPQSEHGWFLQDPNMHAMYPRRHIPLLHLGVDIVLYLGERVFILGYRNYKGRMNLPILCHILEVYFSNFLLEVGYAINYFEGLWGYWRFDGKTFN